MHDLSHSVTSKRRLSLRMGRELRENGAPDRKGSPSACCFRRPSLGDVDLRWSSQKDIEKVFTKGVETRRLAQFPIRDSAAQYFSVENWPFLALIILKAKDIDVLGSFFIVFF